MNAGARRSERIELEMRQAYEAALDGAGQLHAALRARGVRSPEAMAAAAGGVFLLTLQQLAPRSDTLRQVLVTAHVAALMEAAPDLVTLLVQQLAQDAQPS